MSSVASTNSTINPGLADVLNILSNSASTALSSLLSSSKVQSALQNASPADLVQLSDQALQLQAVDSLFGNPDTSQTVGLFGASPATSPTTTLDDIVANLTQPASGSTTAGTAAPSVASQLAIYQGPVAGARHERVFRYGGFRQFGQLARLVSSTLLRPLYSRSSLTRAVRTTVTTLTMTEPSRQIETRRRKLDAALTGSPHGE
jgi:hypothetical protein